MTHNTFSKGTQRSWFVPAATETLGRFKNVRIARTSPPFVARDHVILAKEKAGTVGPAVNAAP